MNSPSIKEQSSSKKITVIRTPSIFQRLHQITKPLSVLLIFFLVTTGYMLFEPYWVEKKKYTIYSNEIPAMFDGMKIVFLTDIHHGAFYSRSRVRNIVNSVNRVDADIVVLGGDYVEGSPRYIHPCFIELGLLRGRYGVFGVLGNHDHWQSADSCRKEMKKSGIRSIDNNAYWVYKNKQRIRIGGVGDHCEDKQYLNRTIDSAVKSDFVLLVSHSPDYAMEITSDKVDCIFSGHTHGGQITLFGMYAPKVPSRYKQKLRTGIVIINNMKIIISNGVGTALLPLRFFARPQIVIAELNCGNCK